MTSTEKVQSQWLLQFYQALVLAYFFLIFFFGQIRTHFGCSYGITLCHWEAIISNDWIKHQKQQEKALENNSESISNERYKADPFCLAYVPDLTIMVPIWLRVSYQQAAKWAHLDIRIIYTYLDWLTSIREPIFDVVKEMCSSPMTISSS